MDLLNLHISKIVHDERLQQADYQRYLAENGAAHSDLSQNPPSSSGGGLMALVQRLITQFHSKPATSSLR